MVELIRLFPSSFVHGRHFKKVLMKGQSVKGASSMKFIAIVQLADWPTKRDFPRVGCAGNFRFFCKEALLLA